MSSEQQKTNTGSIDIDLLISQYLDQDLQESDFKRLESWLAQDRRNIDVFVQRIGDHNRTDQVIRGNQALTFVSESGDLFDEAKENRQLKAQALLEVLGDLEPSNAEIDLVDITEAYLEEEKHASDRHASRDEHPHGIKLPTAIQIIIPKPLFYGGIAALLLLGVALVSVFVPAARNTSPVADAVPPPAVDDPVVPFDASPLVIVDAATITDTSDAAWDSDVEDGDLLAPGTRLSLRGGYAELTFKRGAVVTLEAPCTIEILDDNAAKIDRGLLTASVPPSAHLFTIHTPTAQIIDYGTVFAINVDDTGATEAAVLSGTIELSELSTESGSPARNVRLTEGWTSRVDASGDLAREPRHFTSTGKHKYVTDIEDTKQPGFAYRQAVLEDNPMVYWRFDTKGVRIKNEAGQRRWDGRRIGETEIAEGLFGGALSLAGDLKAMGGAQSLQRLDFEGVEAYSLELWCWIDANHHGRLMGLDFLDRKTGGVYPVTMSVLETLGPKGFRASSNSLRLLHRDPPGTDTATGTNLFTKDKYPTGRWTHIVAVKSASEMQIYIDGELSAELHDTQAVDQDLSPDLVVGVSSTMHNDRRIDNKSVHRPFDGLIDEVAVYGHALSADQVKNHFKLGNPDAEAAPEE